MTALTFEDRSWNYRELYADVCRFAHGLGELAGPGDRVAVLTENNPEYVLAYYSVPLAGMALVFVNYRLAPREVVNVLSDSRPTVLVTEEKFLRTARAAAEVVASITTIVSVDSAASGTVSFASLMDGRPVTEPAPPDQDAPAWLLYTSGTTGRAKGAVLTHRNVTAAVTNAGVSWATRDEWPAVSLCPWPLCHIAGYGVVVSHLHADTVVLLRRYDPDGFLAAVQQHRVTATTVAPTMLAMLLHHHPAVAAAAVVGAPDEVWGERVVAMVEPVAGQAPTEEEIREFCRQRLAGYKCPRQVLLVAELPRNTVGKVLKRGLRELVRDDIDNTLARFVAS